MIDNITKYSLDDVRAAYKNYLNGQDLSRNTIMTSSTDAFYIWRKRSADTFWNVVFSKDFERLGKDTLLEILRQQSNGNAKSNVNSYMAHLRKFRRFLDRESVIEIPEVTTQSTKTSRNPHAKMKHNLPTPSVEQVEYYLSEWNSLEDYRLQEDALNRLFFDLCPANTDISEVLLKVSVLNDFYSTNIFKVYPVAKHIISLHIDERLLSNDVTLVDDIKKVIISDKKREFYSFASKYCSHHNPIAYPIYDSYVGEVLRHYRKQDGFSSFSNHELKIYKRFKEILHEFRTFYQLERYNLKELDKYLWQIGKRHFNKYD